MIPGRRLAVEIGKPGQRQRGGCDGRTTGRVGVVVERRLAGEGDAIAGTGRVADRAAVRHLLSKLVIDAAAVLEVEDAVAAAQHGASRAEGIVGKAKARGIVVEVVFDDGAGEAVLVGKVDVIGDGVERGFAVVLLGGVGEDVVTDPKIESQLFGDFPVVLREDTVLEVAGAEEAGLRTDRVVVGEACQDLRWSVSGEVGVAEVEVSLSGDGAEEGHVTADGAAAELEDVMTAGVGNCVVQLIGVFRHGVAAVVAGVFEVGVAADKSAATEIGGAIGVDDAEVGRDGRAGKDGVVGKGVAVVAGANSLIRLEVKMWVSPRA